MHDWGGYDFPLELSEELVRRGARVVHAYCGDRPGVKGRLTAAGQTGRSPEIVELCAGASGFVTHGSGRLASEIRYGRELARLVARQGPFDVAISANTPLLSQFLLQRECRRSQAAFVYWQQDVLGLGMRRVLASRFGIIGRLIGWVFVSLERSLLAGSNAVVTIAPGFLNQIPSHVTRRAVVVPNWARLEHIPDGSDVRRWASRHSVDGRTVFLYAGTLGLKHQPDLLVDLAQAVGVRGVVVVIAEGAGVEVVRRAAEGTSNLIVLPFLEREELPLALAASDVLLALLSEDAGAFSVPSKVLRYLVAGKPVVAAVPASNPIADLLRRVGAGLVTPPDSSAAFADAALSLGEDTQMRWTMGENGRRYAERAFAIETITDRFLDVFGRVTSSARPMTGGRRSTSGPGWAE